VIIADSKAKPEPAYIKTKHVRARKRSLHEATARKGRRVPNRTQKRNNKNVFKNGKFRRWDTVRYIGKAGFISGFTSGNACYIIDIHGNYIKNPAKSYKQVSLKQVRLIHRNNCFLRHFFKDA
jgi:hypothetical protein